MARSKWVGCSLLVALVLAIGFVRADQDDEDGPGPTAVNKNGYEVEERSTNRLPIDPATLFDSVSLTEASPVPGLLPAPQVQMRGINDQANDAALDNIQIFPRFRPFIFYTQSETSIAGSGRNIVATYNSTADSVLTLTPSGLVYDHSFYNGYSVSHDGGLSWTSGSFPPVPGSIFTNGDPSIDVDRQGHFYFAGLGTDAAFRNTVQVNTSTDGGYSWSDAIVVQQDDGSDKEWIAVGRDPVAGNRDNVYVTWTSFQSAGSELRFSRSFDGGHTWETKTIFAPTTDPNPAHPQNFVQFSTPYVDQTNGRLYVPFLQLSNGNSDVIRILKSDDAGETFSFINFNVAGAPSPSMLPIVQSGELLDMRSGGVRLGIHAGPFIPGRFGLRQFRQVSRLITQPGFAARNGVLYLAWSNSTSAVFGDPASGSNMLLVRSTDDGATWSSAMQVNPTVAGDKHHVLGALTIDTDPNDVHVSYYTQHADETLDVDMANSHDGGVSFPANRAIRLTSTNFAIPPSVVRLTATTTTNYDREVIPGYALGEYMSIRSFNGAVHALWGDARNLVTHPVNALDPLSGVTHSQTDVVYQKIKAQ
jgi:hypothetical protein